MSVTNQIGQPSLQSLFYITHSISQIDQKINEIAKRMLVVLAISFALFVGALLSLIMPAYALTGAISLLSCGVLLLIAVAIDEIRQRILSQDREVLNQCFSLALDWMERGVRWKKEIVTYLQEIAPFNRNLRDFLQDRPIAIDEFVEQSGIFLNASTSLRQRLAWKNLNH